MIDPTTGEEVNAPYRPGYLPGATVVNVPARPLHESTSTVEQRTFGPMSEEARRAALVAEGGALTARERVGEANAQVAGAEAAGATAEASLLEQQRARNKAEAEREKQDREAKLQEIKDGVAERVLAKRKAGAARADYWNGNEAGEVAAAIFRGIQSGIQSFRGASGPTDAERILEARMNAHERKLVGQYEALEENHRLKKENYDLWEAGRTKARAQAAQENLEELGIVRAKALAFGKSLAPEQQRALADLTGKLETLASRQADQKLAAGYDAEKKFVSTNRTESGGAGSGANKADDNTVFDPKTGQPLFRATTTKQAQDVNKNGSTIVGLTNDAREYAQIMRQLPKGSFLPGAGLVQDEATQAMVSRANTLREGMIGQLTQATGAGAPSGTEKKDFIKALDRGNAQDVEAHAKAVEGLADSTERKFYDQTRAFGNTGANGETLRKQAADKMGMKEDGTAKDKDKSAGDREKYRQGIARAKAAGRDDLVKTLEAELAALK